VADQTLASTAAGIVPPNACIMAFGGYDDVPLEVCEDVPVMVAAIHCPGCRSVVRAPLCARHEPLALSKWRDGKYNCRACHEAGRGSYVVVMLEAIRL
jgi:hypothetical protein